MSNKLITDIVLGVSGEIATLFLVGVVAIAMSLRITVPENLAATSDDAVGDLRKRAAESK